jgi:hypothetical protein
LALVPALAVQLGLIAGIAGLSRLVERRPRDRARAPRIASSWLRGPWPLAAGAAALALVNVATLLLAGHPWGITFAFGLWGAKTLSAAGVEVATWPYWAQFRVALAASIWTDITSVMNIGIVAGALAAAALAGRLKPSLHLTASELATAVVGGLLLGYGARLAYGCNIGAFFSGVASGSAHGWLWLVCAFAGFCLADRMRTAWACSVPPATPVRRQGAACDRHGSSRSSASRPI